MAQVRALNFVYLPTKGAGGCISSSLYREYPTAILAATACNINQSACWIERIPVAAPAGTYIWRVYSGGAVLNPALVDPASGKGQCSLWRKSRYAYTQEGVVDLESSLAKTLGEWVSQAESSATVSPGKWQFPVGVAVDISGVKPLDVIPSGALEMSSAWLIPPATGIPSVYFKQPAAFYKRWPTLFEASAWLTYSKNWSTVPKSVIPKASLVLWDTPNVDNYIPGACSLDTLISAHFLEGHQVDLPLSSVLPGKQSMVSGKWTIVAKVPSGTWDFQLVLPSAAVNVYVGDRLMAIKDPSNPSVGFRMTVPTVTGSIEAPAVVWTIDFAVKPSELILPPSTSGGVSDPGFEFAIAPLMTSSSGAKVMLSSFAVANVLTPMGSAAARARAMAEAKDVVRCEAVLTAGNGGSLVKTLEGGELAACVSSGAPGYLIYSDNVKAELANVFASLNSASTLADLPKSLTGSRGLLSSRSSTWPILEKDLQVYISDLIFTYIASCLSELPDTIPDSLTNGLMGELVPWSMARLQEAGAGASDDGAASLLREMLVGVDVVRWCIANPSIPWCKSVLGIDDATVRDFVCASLSTGARAQGDLVCDVTPADAVHMAETCGKWLDNWDTCERWLLASSKTTFAEEGVGSVGLSALLSKAKRSAFYASLLSPSTEMDRRWLQYAKEIAESDEGPDMVLFPELEAFCKDSQNIRGDKCVGVYDAVGKPDNQIRIAREDCARWGEVSSCPVSDVWNARNAHIYGDVVASQCLAAYSAVGNGGDPSDGAAQKAADLLSACDKYYEDILSAGRGSDAGAPLPGSLESLEGSPSAMPHIAGAPADFNLVWVLLVLLVGCAAYYTYRVASRRYRVLVSRSSRDVSSTHQVPGDSRASYM